MWIDTKYIGLISSRLERFRRVSDNTYNFRCPVCGDSHRDKHKARGYLFSTKDKGFLYHCHNCHITLGLDKLIELIDSLLFVDYRKEKFTESFTPRERTDAEVFADKMKKPVFMKKGGLESLKKISALEYNHPAKLYVEKRGIPSSYHYKLFYAPKFKKFVNSIIPNKFENLENDSPRLIIPFLNKDKQMFGFQGRAFDSKSLRYITIMLDENQSKVFNLDSVNLDEQHFVLEGPIDAMFVKNSIAMAGQSIDWSLCNENSVFIFDNEPRNDVTCKKVKQAIDKGFGVVILPDYIKQKDINDIVMSYKGIDIDALLRDNVYSGLKAEIRFTQWRKL